MDWGMDSILFQDGLYEMGDGFHGLGDGFHIFFVPFFHKFTLRFMWAEFILNLVKLRIYNVFNKTTYINLF